MFIITYEWDHDGQTWTGEEAAFASIKDAARHILDGGYSRGFSARCVIGLAPLADVSAEVAHELAALSYAAGDPLGAAAAAFCERHGVGGYLTDAAIEAAQSRAHRQSQADAAAWNARTL